MASGGGEGTGTLLKEIKRTLSSCDEIVIATDVDPTGEGGMIAGNIIRELDLESKSLSSGGEPEHTLSSKTHSSELT